MKTVIAFALGLIAAPALFAVAAMTGMLPTDSRSEPPRWEAAFAMRALDTSLEKRSKGLSDPIGPNDKTAIATGEKIYADDCAGCHGDRKGPSNWGANGLYPRPPQFFQEGSDVTAPEAFAAIRDGIRYSGMAAWRGQMKEDDMWKVAKLVAGIHAKGGAMKGMD
jgi:mono/diheme cytochrome c family protein